MGFDGLICVVSSPLSVPPFFLALDVGDFSGLVEVWEGVVVRKEGGGVFGFAGVGGGLGGEDLHVWILGGSGFWRWRESLTLRVGWGWI